MQHESGICFDLYDKPVEDCQFLGGRVSVKVVEENNKMIVRKITFAVI